MVITFTNEDRFVNVLTLDTLEQDLLDLFEGYMGRGELAELYDVLYSFYFKFGTRYYVSPPLTDAYCLIFKTLIDLIRLDVIVDYRESISTVIENAKYYLGLSGDETNTGNVDFRSREGRFILVKDLSKHVRICPVS